MQPIDSLLPQLSYRGRDLVASTLWHKLNALQTTSRSKSSDSKALSSFIFGQDTIGSDLLYCIFLYKKGDKAWLI